MRIETAEITFLSLERAFKKAPADYIPAYEWFLDHEGPKPIKRPTRNNIEPSDELNVTLVSGGRGIHKPDGPYQHALSVISRRNSFYNDGIIDQDDGTWILNYSPQRQNEGSGSTTNVFNDALRECMRDGLPVGVFIESPSRLYRYECKGLAFVESYEDGIFVLHGPVRRDQDKAFWALTSDEDISPETAKVIAELDEEDERVFKAVIQARRVGQSRFRDNLLKAYDRRCTVSNCDVEPALQAAHISSYLGPNSQKTSNGLLLRADLHLLYDSSLMSVDPDGYKVKLAPSIKNSHYGIIDGLKVRLPYETSDRPSEARLQAHFEKFLLKQGIK